MRSNTAALCVYGLLGLLELPQIAAGRLAEVMRARASVSRNMQGPPPRRSRAVFALSNGVVLTESGRAKNSPVQSCKTISRSVTDNAAIERIAEVAGKEDRVIVRCAFQNPFAGPLCSLRVEGKPAAPVWPHDLNRGAKGISGKQGLCSVRPHADRELIRRMSRRGLETKSRKKLLTGLGGIDQAGVNHGQKAVMRDPLGHSSLREKGGTKNTLHVLAAKDVAGIRKGRHRTITDVHGVPDDVVHMQMGDDDVLYVA